MIAEAPARQHLTITNIRFEAAPAPTAQRSTTTSQRGPKVVTVEMTKEPTPWLKQALDRISALTALAEGWDGYGGRAVDASVVMDAVRFLTEVAYPGISNPSIVPLATGGLQIEWHRGGVDVEVIFCDEDPGLLVLDHDSGDEHELPISDAASEVTRLLGRLRET